MRTILLVGGAGYVGTVVTEYLLSLGYKVKNLDLFLYNNEHCISKYLNNKNYQSITGNFCKSETLTNALEGVSDVVLLAGLVGDPITKKYPLESKKINEIGMVNCIDLLNKKGLNRVILVSTCSNYGIVSSDKLVDEKENLDPQSLYAKAKVATEKYLLEKKNKVDYIPTILRFSTAFGLSNRMRFDLTINEFCRELFLGKTLLVFNPNTWRPYCHVLDFARLINMILVAPKDKIFFEVFNAGGNKNNFTKGKIVDLLLSYIPKGKVEYLKKDVDPRNYRVSFDKVRNTLGFKPNYEVEYGIKEIIQAFKINKFSNFDKHTYGNYVINYPN
jgi:nucleoside-diphosphate-sugar epimerase|tara:strand:- start:421 stop:1413 length:993 start_codon:yes stop_codon:yes gene_type:complete